MARRPARTFSCIVRPCDATLGRYRWIVTSSDSLIREISADAYGSVEEARVAGNARARALGARDFAVR
ncbi:hypothetical protein [Methylobacterium sp. Leaf118]|uniref:hypothetical protein n=1 Tax=Methylobacterium sp. Leaf118 TaxID=2876562 RepID=UPI001E484DCA|nr:hypothetical protein [Methylobacterium sp. Leaf118]